jgi:hypothetical protein
VSTAVPSRDVWIAFVSVKSVDLVKPELDRYH